MKKFMLDLTIKENIALNNDYVLLILTSSQSLPDIIPGQFVEVRVDDSPTTFLRRPISVHFVDYIKNELWLLIQVIGDGTRKLASLKSGNLNLLMPLGNGFTIPTTKSSAVLLVGGGCGIAPLLFLGSTLKECGFNPVFLLGARSQKQILQFDVFKKFGDVYITTEDGSEGERGFVTQHSILKSLRFDMIYSCGPTAMMKAVAAFAYEHNVECEVSLENTMACGIGACLCCVTDTTDGHVCVCTEGPVFNISKLKWQI